MKSADGSHFKMKVKKCKAESKSLIKDGGFTNTEYANSLKSVHSTGIK